MRYLYLIAVVFLFAMCNRNKDSINNESKNSGIDSVFVTYFCGIIDSNVAIKCEKIAAIQSLHPENDYSVPIQVVDTFISESSALKRIETLLEKKQTTSNFNDDARMYVTVKYSNGNFDTICLGDNTPQAKYNGEPFVMENELIYLLRYFSGYYKWIDESYFPHLIELHDTTFIKMPLIK